MNSPTHSASSTTDSKSLNTEDQKLIPENFSNSVEPAKRSGQKPLLERLRSLIIMIKESYQKLDPSLKKTLETVVRLGGMGFLTYFSINGIINFTERKYKSLGVLLVALEAIYVAIQALRSNGSRYKLALFAIIVFVYFLFLKANLYENKEVVEFVASKKVKKLKLK
mmetsp:Transcript_44572/g.51501  ORF Transcript_44572/g.51501 Transcript_44572/m.51501 type:complete len:167 (-) Transcript_44572:347-847(-)